jgi:REP-associated tyrosine transposase
MNTKIFYRRNLPHFHFEYSYYFITFRLFNSLQKEIVLKLKKEYYNNKKVFLKISNKRIQKIKLYELQKRYFGKFDYYLDTNQECINYLSAPEIAKIVYEAIRYRDGKEYELISFCIMPNHVHMLIFVKRFVKPFYRVMQSLKRYTATESNKIINRKGSFWHEESFDHIVRNREEYHNILNYIMYNPVKAGLVKKISDWKWSYCRL